MTAKQIVQRRYPNAVAYQWAGPQGWIVYLKDIMQRSVGTGSPTARQAWAAARKELRLRNRSDSGGNK
jgi:hypothetical protein